MRVKTPVLVAGIVTTLIAPAAHADFSLFTWTLNDNEITASISTPGGPEFAGVETVLGTTSSGGSGSLTSATMITTGGSAGANGLTWYRTVATASYTVSVDWVFTTTDLEDFDAGGWVRNGVFTKLAGSAGSGTVTFSVIAGDVYGFGTATSDGLFGAGTTKFTNFVPAPGAIGLLAMAGLAGSRRRR
jgi:uncharacterized protein (TIGR03382 family)